MKSLAWSIERLITRRKNRCWLFYSEHGIFYKILKKARNDINQW